MIKMKRYYFTILLVGFCVLNLRLFSQEISTQEEHNMHLLKNDLLNSENASGLIFTDFKQYGISDLGYKYKKTDLNRAQSGDTESGLEFVSERYDRILTDWYTWGKFEFHMNREKNRNWSSVFNTYDDSPYIFGDSVKSSYDKQFFDLQAKIAKRFGSKVALGIGLNYYAGDMSRLRDPRTRSYLVNYSFVPGLMYAINDKNTIGFNIGVGFEKEKMPSITTVQTDPKIDYYFFLGNENAYSVLDGYKGFDRQYVTFHYNFGLQYNLKTVNAGWSNDFGLKIRKQEVLGSERESPGNYLSSTINASSQFYYQFKKHILNMHFKANYKNGFADEFLQERIEIRDTVTGSTSKEWITLYTYDNRYVNNVYDFSLNVDLRNLIKNGNDYSWMAGIKAYLDGFSNKYYLPYSAFESQRLSLGAYGSVRLFEKNTHSMNVSMGVDYIFNTFNNVELNSIASLPETTSLSSAQQATQRVASEIILKDAELFKQDVLSFSASINYAFPIMVKKTRLTGQLKLHGNYKSASTFGDESFIGASFGIITF